MDTIFSNISLSNNLPFFALSAVLIPLILHFLNPNKAKIIWIAHIDFIRDTKLKRILQIKWLDKFLLILRLLIFCLLALVLAEPVFYTLPDSVDEQHIFISEDWLLNATDSDRNTLLVKQKNSKHVKYFQLEKPENFYRDFLSLKKSISKPSINRPLKNEKNLNNRGSFNGASSQDYIHELMRRRTVPKRTGIYITNREKSFNIEVLDFSSSPKYELNVLKLTMDHLVRKPTLKLLYPKNGNKQYQTATQLLKVALAALNIEVQTEWLMIKSALDADINADINADIRLAAMDKSTNEKVDLIFVLGKKILGFNGNNTAQTVYVEPSPSGLIFSVKNRMINQWNKEAPNDLLQILSQIIESTPISVMQHRVNENQFTPLTTKNRQGNNLIGFHYSQSLLKYILFLISLIWLTERRLSLGGS